MTNRFEIFTTQISKISKCIRKLKNIKSSKFNLTGPSVYCIYYLYKHTSGLTAKELSVLTDEDKGALSRTLEYLEQNKFIYYLTNEKKRYNSTIFLTEKGKNVGEEFVKVIDNLINDVGLGVDEKEREIFYKSLIIFTNNLQKICGNLGEDYD